MLHMEHNDSKDNDNKETQKIGQAKYKVAKTATKVRKGQMLRELL